MTETDLVIVSMHEKDFPQADMYRFCGGMDAAEFEALGCAPDDFFTMKRGDSLSMAQSLAAIRWPGAKIVIADDEDYEDEEAWTTQRDEP
jgi:hypothetical protein